MAQKYLVAFDHVDVHANNVLRKHAKKRPLGDIETRHRYNPVQPVLSCRTVAVDVSGTRTYRPKSSADIINEQHALIHKIYTKARNVASAPPKRSIKSPWRVADENSINEQKSNTNLQSVEVQGRPLTSTSQRPHTGYERRKPQTSARRPKTTGRIKNNKAQRENYLFIKSSKHDFVEKQRSHRNLTDKIHRQWEPSNHDLNSGTYQRGKKQPDINASVDSWLTFSGSQSDESRGLVDAFAERVPSLHSKLESIEEEVDEEIVKTKCEEPHLDNGSQFYNIEGGVGSRIAHQLHKGDKIRIGINGTVQSQDLKVKKWVKENSYVKEMEPDISVEENLTARVVPLCWEDEIQGISAKVLTPRGPPMDKTIINLCETRPVIFNKLLPDEHSQHDSTSSSKQHGFRVKQRRKNKSGIDGKEHENKVTVLTIDAATEEEEQKIDNLTVDDVIKVGFHGKHADKSTKHSVEFSDTTDKVSVSFNLMENNALHNGAYNHSKSSIADSISSESSDHNLKHPKIKPSQPTFTAKHQTNKVDLDIVGTLTVPNGSRPPSEMAPLSPGPFPKSAQTRCGSARSSRSRQRSAVAPSSIISLGSQSARIEPEFIQISHPVKNPNPILAKKPTDYVKPADYVKQPDYVKQGMTNDIVRGQRTHSGIRERIPSPESVSHESRTEELSPPPMMPVMVKGTSKPTTPSLAINIPTAEYTDSALNSPSHKNVAEFEGSPKDKREKYMRDEQIDQITTLLGDSIIGQGDAQVPDERNKS